MSGAPGESGEKGRQGGAVLDRAEGFDRSCVGKVVEGKRTRNLTQLASGSLPLCRAN